MQIEILMAKTEAISNSYKNPFILGVCKPLKKKMKIVYDGLQYHFFSKATCSDSKVQITTDVITKRQAF